MGSDAEGAGSPNFLSTVLAQDRFFSDSLSFTLGIQDPQSRHDDEDYRQTQESLPALSCRLDDPVLGKTAPEWRLAEHRSTASLTRASQDKVRGG